MIGIAGIWFLLVLGVAVVSNVVPGARLCDRTTVEKPETSQREEVGGPSARSTPGSGPTVPPGSLSSKTTTTRGTIEKTEKCSGVGVAQVAVLLLPGLLPFIPALKDLNIAGLFTLSFREEVTEKLAEQKQAVEAVAGGVTEIRNQINLTQQLMLAMKVETNLNLTMGGAGQTLHVGSRERSQGEVEDLDSVLGGDSAATHLGAAEEDRRAGRVD